MRPELILDDEIFPPFQGFPNEGLKFLRHLKRNNNREWFAKHKSEYEDFVKLPVQSLIAALRAPMAKLAPEIDVSAKRGIFRIYRDTRFSKDKTPYKTHVAAVFHLRGHWEESGGFYLHIEPGTVYVGGGIYMPTGQQIKKIRSAIVDRADGFLSIVEGRVFKKKFRGLEGEKLRRAPLGYPSDHPMIEWLKHKSFYTGVRWGEETCLSRDFVDRVLGVYRGILPLVRFLNGALGK